MVFSFERLPADATPVAGGKGASLARMSSAGLPVPPGFVVSAAAFEAFLSAHDAAGRVGALLEGLDVHDQAALDAAANEIRQLICDSAMPADLETAIRDACQALGGTRVAVRSSAVSEDGEAASFAGQQETFLNVKGADAVLTRVKDCWASFFSPRALFYRAQKGVIADTRMAVVVQEMVAAEKSGVMFTVDPVARRRDRVVIEAVFGLGEGIVSGDLTPDHYVVDREKGSLLEEFVAWQLEAVMLDLDAGGTRSVELPEEQGRSRVLSDKELDDLRKVGLHLENHFGAPQDVEWAIRGNELLLLQSRPITTL
jgi:pyruvate,water dikinase